MRTYLFNVSVIPPEFEGNVQIRNISPQEAGEILINGFESSIGHQSTADVISALLEIKVPVQRLDTRMRDGDVVVAFQLQQRLPEGIILSADELRKLPFQFRVLNFTR
ncbi:MAG: DUF1874 domain-containing protein [Candidatus Thorarchaeota archaeon]|nr:DUF1874 domain-containing protein [Candidatus Thorarchaeota archaeon]